MSIVEAISSVERYLQKPPEEWEVTIKYNGIEPKIVMDFLTELKKETFKLSKYLLQFKTINHNIRI